MGYLVFVVLVLLAAAGVWVAGSIVGNEKSDFRGNAQTTNAKTILHASAVVGALVLLVIITGLRSITTVDPGHIGVVKQFGKLTGTTGNGWVTHSPFSTVQSVSVQDELRGYDMTGINGAGSAGSKDNQPVYVNVLVSYRVDRSRAVDLYNNTGGAFVERYLDPAVYEHTKAIFAKYVATDVLANRERIRNLVELEINKETAPKGIQIRNVTLKDIHFTPELTAAIEQTVQAKQQALREEARVRIVTAEADQRVAKAKGEAEATLTKARAEAQANRLKQATLTPNLLTQLAIEKLNPKVQYIVCDSGKTCIPNAVALVAGK